MYEYTYICMNKHIYISIYIYIYMYIHTYICIFIIINSAIINSLSPMSI